MLQIHVYSRKGALPEASRIFASQAISEFGAEFLQPATLTTSPKSEDFKVSWHEMRTRQLRHDIQVHVAVPYSLSGTGHPPLLLAHTVRDALDHLRVNRSLMIKVTISTPTGRMISPPVALARNINVNM